MKIITEKTALSTIKNTTPIYFNDMVKGVVDIDKGIIAIHAEMHSDCEQLLLNSGSRQENLIGFNIYYDDKEIELDSNINPPINKKLGYPRAGRIITEPNTVKIVNDIIRKWVDLDA